ncbi:hypothetical protein L596_013601 [Steinernema carpocapsae]|uniref:G-protein coupled receptors family 1 profile domain-containing protein n=1 Tax=Steinernema carpocapsae TaxID=34508 RepID=A0A4U5P0P3_STECR|nr:hypothetical protein L596_013601 [Steinernema carpocapsae]
MQECARQVSTSLNVIGGQWPSLLTLMLGLERLSAVLFPFWFHRLNSRHQIISALFTSVFTFSSMGVGLYMGLVVTPDEPTVFVCSIGKSYGSDYATYNYGITIAGHVIGFTTTMLAFFITRVQMERAGFNRRKELQNLK